MTNSQNRPSDYLINFARQQAESALKASSDAITKADKFIAEDPTNGMGYARATGHLSAQVSVLRGDIQMLINLIDKAYEYGSVEL